MCVNVCALIVSIQYHEVLLQRGPGVHEWYPSNSCQGTHGNCLVRKRRKAKLHDAQLRLDRRGKTGKESVCCLKWWEHGRPKSRKSIAIHFICLTGLILNFNTLPTKIAHVYYIIILVNTMLGLALNNTFMNGEFRIQLCWYVFHREYGSCITETLLSGCLAITQIHFWQNACVSSQSAAIFAPSN